MIYFRDTLLRVRNNISYTYIYVTILGDSDNSDVVATRVPVDEIVEQTNPGGVGARRPPPRLVLPRVHAIFLFFLFFTFNTGYAF